MTGDRAGRRCIDGCKSVGSLRGARGKRASARQLDVRFDVIQRHGSGGAGFGFQRPHLDGTVHLAKVVDAGSFLGFGASADEIGDRDGSQETDDRDHDHDFDESESRITIFLDLHNFTFRFPSRRERGTGVL